jgi:hypothetical protein
LLLLIVVLPLVSGERTLFFRDVFNTHLEMKWFQAEALKQGYLPLVDPFRAGGQPHLGNPNTVALYPDNLLLLVASPIWVLNAHFWIHLLLTPLTMFWLARRWGLGREAAWVAGVCYAASGYFLSTLNLYNLIAPAALAPALAAELLGLSTANRPARRTWVGALIWALLLTAGDPMTAVMALGLAVLAVLVRDGWRRPQWGRMMVAVAAGTLVAAPQVIEFLRILALSYRGHWGYSASAATAASWNPITALEWLIPLAFGFPDFTFWGHRFYFGDQPLFYSLYPGLLALALIAVGWRPRVPAARAGIVRLPVKFWLLVAVGASILCGLGFQRATTRDGRRALSGSLGVLLLIFLVAWTWLTVTPARIEGLIADLLPANHPSEVAQFVRLRWAGVSFFSCCLAAGFLMAARLLPRQPRVLPALLLFGHLAAQLFFLAPLFETDDPGAYQAPSKVQNRVPEGSRVVHGAHLNLFGPVPVPLGEYPDPSARWFQRQSFEEFHPWVGMRRGRKFDFNLSPEGLDSFLTRAGGVGPGFRRVDGEVCLPRGRSASLPSHAPGSCRPVRRQPAVLEELERVLGSPAGAGSGHPIFGRIGGRRARWRRKARDGQTTLRVRAGDRLGG